MNDAEFKGLESFVLGEPFLTTLLCCHFQELLSLAKRKRVDSGEQEEPVGKPAASTDSETSDSDDEVSKSEYFLYKTFQFGT